MMRYLFYFAAVVWTMTAFSQTDQNLYAKSCFVLDSVHIHWVPKDIEVFKAMFDKELTVEIIPWNTSALPTKSDLDAFPMKEAYKYGSTQKQIQSDSLDLSPKALLLLNGILNATEELTSEMLYANAVILSGIERELSKDLGLYVSVKTNFHSEFVAYRISYDTSLVVLGVCKLQSIAQNQIVFDSLTSKVQYKEATLIWNQQELTKHFSAYTIVRSVDKKNFIKLNETPYLHLVSEDEQVGKPAMFVDKTIERGKVYYYKVIGINHLGFEAGVSNTIEVKVPRPIEGYLQIDSIYLKGKINIHSSLKAGKQELEYLKGYELYHTDSLNAGFGLLKSMKNEGLYSNFEVNINAIGSRGYFKIAAISKTDDTLFSEPRYYFFRDSIPPEVVSGLSGAIDTNGILRLKWNRVEDNLLGYRVFMTNSLKEEFVELTERFVTDTMFRDSVYLKNLTKEIYYSVVAVDRNFNNSKFCTPLKLQKPDLVAPVPAHFGKTKISEKGIELTWIKSPSSDVAKIELQKYQGLNYLGIIVPKKDTFYLDDAVENGSKYTYRLLTEDSSSNKSYSQEIKINFELGYRLAPKNFRYTVDREKNHIYLSWENNADLYATKIYISKNGEGFRLFKTLFENKSNLVINRLYINNEYRFKIQNISKDGALSKMTKELIVIY